MFFLPMFDDNPTSRWPLICWLIMALCIAVFLYQLQLGGLAERRLLFSYAVVPLVLSGGEALPAELVRVHPWMTLLTSTFLHGGVLHLGGNMLYLWIFGDNVEDSMGSLRFLLFYFLCGAVAALTEVMINPGSAIPLIGASGAIAGVLAAYLLSFPRAKVRVMLVILVFVRWIKLPAFIVLGLWVALQFIAVPSALMASQAGTGGVAYFAHIGGFVAGLVLTPLFRRRGWQRPDAAVAGSNAETSNAAAAIFSAAEPARPGQREQAKQAADSDRPGSPWQAEEGQSLVSEADSRPVRTREIRNEFIARYRKPPRHSTTRLPSLRRKG